MRVGDRTDFNKLSLEIETDGTISPEAAFFKACEILINHYNVIFEGNVKMPKQDNSVSRDKEKDKKEVKRKKTIKKKK